MEVNKAVNEGDKVRHILGGPEMVVYTVHQTAGPQLVYCRWWNAKKEVFDNQQFLSEELEKCE